MRSGLIAQKVGMTRLFTADGEHVPVTVLKVDNLQVVAVYGVRNDTSHNIWDVKINTRLSAGAVPIDVSQVVIRFSDGGNAGAS